MKTNAPGPFSCEIYIKSWELGYRNGSTKIHIDNCPFCSPIVHGGTEEFPLSAADQAKLNIKERKRASRRLFFKKTAVAASLVVASIVGFDHFRGSVKSGTTVTMESKIGSDFAALDSFYATLGRARIESRLTNGTTQRRIWALEWIQKRQHVSMYDLICESLKDRDYKVRLASYRLLRSIDPVALKPHRSAITSSMSVLKNDEFKNQISRLLLDIESS